MATIKSYTDISQSKTLSNILLLESADMYYDRYGTPSFIDKYVTHESIKSNKYHDIIPCWSLAALLYVIPKRIKDYNVLSIDISDNNFAIWYSEIGFGTNNDLPDITTESAVDACVAVIEKLHELNLL